VRDGQIYQVDARPSDSIALALRLNAPIFTDASLLEQGSVESSDQPPDPGLDAERLRAYLEKMDPRISASSIRKLPLVCSLILAPAGLAAQANARAGGRVIQGARLGLDSRAADQCRAASDRPGRAGPDRFHADRLPRRAFHFRFAADTSAIFLLSARFAGIEYFSPPVHTDPALPDTAMI
jgi:hypothetical protein